MNRPRPNERTQNAGGPTVVNRIWIAREPDAVFDHLTDLQRELEWNDKLLAVELLTDEPLQAGSRYRVRFAGPVGESMITYHEVDRPSHWRTSSSSPRLRVRLTGSIESADGGSEVTLRTTLQPRGWLRLLGPLVRRTMHTSWEHHLATIKRSLEPPNRVAGGRS